MKLFFLLIAFSFIQQTEAQKKTFMRVYRIGTVKAVRGLYAGFADSAIIIFNHRQRDTIFYSGIRQIRTRRSGGHNILLGAVSGLVGGAVTGLATYKKHVVDPLYDPAGPNC